MLDRLNELSREEVPLAPPPTPITGPKGKKTNRQKQRKAVKAARMEEMREQAGQEASEQVDMRKVEDEAIAELLSSMKLSLKEVGAREERQEMGGRGEYCIASEFFIPVKADGHCLYNAISDQLATRHSSKINYQILRKDAAAYMRKHPADFIPFLSKDDGEMYSLGAFGIFVNNYNCGSIWLFILNNESHPTAHVLCRGVPAVLRRD
ncbi:hypothetical protein BC937DRAFT_93136 [Endogone sp. FLAS-F59071]|nr:hypothetical protein BC937DRAFT_93136 [Endogone sp. FLAS-F59071]|eukprot:RUS14937.1 hypothetical protein BC937DRAFT_93136 [Endogone sp. FLAS-F59071]